MVAQDATREADLVPVRHGRMMVSPFTFYRGAAKVMAADLAGTPTAGLDVQLCGDAHLSNFGGFASPERQLLFGLNDFDETLPGPFEYDLKRMAASFTIAARNNGFTPADDACGDRGVGEGVPGGDGASSPRCGPWTSGMPTCPSTTSRRRCRHSRRTATSTSDSKTGKGKGGKKRGRPRTATKPDSQVAKSVKVANKTLRKAHTRDSLQALTRVRRGRRRPVSHRQPAAGSRAVAGARRRLGSVEDQIREVVEDQFRAYQASLSADRRLLLERFRIVDMARKVVGVGSVGTRAFMVLLEGRDDEDPLFLQVKEATRSVLEDHLPNSRFPHPGPAGGRRPAADAGRLDIFLGWTKGRAGRPLLLLAPTARHEGICGGRDHEPVRDDLLRPDVRMDPRPRTRPLG